MNTEGLNRFTVLAYCCREWEVSPLAPMGRCGYCGERPIIPQKEDS